MSIERIRSMELLVSNEKVSLETKRREFADLKVANDRVNKAIHELKMAKKMQDDMLGSMSYSITTSMEYVASLEADIMLAKQDMAQADEEECQAREEERSK